MQAIYSCFYFCSSTWLLLVIVSLHSPSPPSSGLSHSPCSCTRQTLLFQMYVATLSVSGDSGPLNDIYIYIFVEPFLSVRKLLPQRACDRRETRDYYGAPHGACREGVDGRRDAASEESAARFPSWTEKDAMFFVGLRTLDTRFRVW